MSAGSNSSCSCSCRGAAVFVLLCLAASTVSGATDAVNAANAANAANGADLFGIGITIQRNPPPRTVVRLPFLQSGTSSKTVVAAPPTLPHGLVADTDAAPAAVMVAVPSATVTAVAVPAVADTTAAAAGAAGAGTVTTTTTTTTVITTTTGLAGPPPAVTIGTAAPILTPSGATATVVTMPARTTPPATVTVVTTPSAGVPPIAGGTTTQVPALSTPSSLPMLKPAFAKNPAAPTQQQQQPSGSVQPSTPAAATAPAGGMTALQPVMTAPPPASSSSSSSNAGLPPIPVPLAGPTIQAPPPFVFTQKDAKQTLLVGCSVPFEGSQQLVGQAVFSALKMAVTQLVPKELPGFNVNVTCINSKCEDIPAYMAVSKFAAEGAIGVIGEICSRASVAAAGVANMRKIPVISPASTSPSLSETDFFFRTVPSDRYQGVTAANLVHKSGANTTAVVYEDSAYGYGLAFNFIAGFTKDRGTVPVVYQFKAGKGDAQAAAADVKAGVQSKGVQAVFVSTNNLTFAAEFLVAAKAANLSLPIYAGDALSDYMLYEKIAGRPSLISSLTSTSVSPGSREFVQAFSNFTRSDPSTSYQAYAAHAYDAVAALLRAYKAAAAPKDGTAVKEQLNKTDFKGVGGHVKFDDFGDLVPDNQTYVAVKFNSTSGARMFQGFVTR